MYLSKLFNLARQFSDLTEKNLDSIDNFLGETGPNNIFTKRQFLGILTQKNFINEILEWLLKENIIQPYKVECNNCKKEVEVSNDNCPYCSNKLDLTSDYIVEYKIIAALNLPHAVIEENKNKSLKLDKSCFSLLLKTLQKKYEKREKSFIIFSDIKASTDIKKYNSSIHEKICRGAVQFFKDVTLPYFRQYKGIYIKSEGDASYVFLDSIETVIKFIKDINDKIITTEMYSLMNNLNSQNVEIIDENGIKRKIITFLKFYIADSETGKYTQKDILSIDFDAMEAFTFIKRIETKAKEKVLYIQSPEILKENFPICIFARANWFEGESQQLEDVDDYGNTDIFYSNNESIKTYLKKRFD